MHTITKLSVLAAIAVLAMPAHAQSAYVISHAGTQAGPAYQFGTVDLQTGTYTIIATNTAYQYIYGLGFGSNGTLYGLASDSNNAGYFVDKYAISTTTGAVSYRGSVANAEFAGGSADSSGVFTGLTYTNAQSSSILTDNLATPGLGGQSGQTSFQAQGLVASDGAGSIYAASYDNSGAGPVELHKITNLRTGASTLLGPTGLRDAEAAFFSGGSLYTFGFDKNNNVGLYTLSTTTGAANLTRTLLLPTGSFVQASALASAPEPSPAVAVLVGMIGLGALAVRARRRASRV